MDSKGLTRLVREAQHSDEAMCKLIRNFEPLIKKLAHILSPHPQEREDAEQEFRIALVKAVRRCPVDHFVEETELPMVRYITNALKNRLTRLGSQNKRIFDSDMRQAKLAEIVGISSSHLSNIETGNAKVSLPTLVYIANALDVPLADLLCDSLVRAKESYCKECDILLSDCNDQEARFITDMISAAIAALRKNNAFCGPAPSSDLQKSMVK